jgi:anti-sigma factor RsiW
MGSKSITDWDIQALIDNELSAEEQRHVLQALQEDRALQDRYNRLKGQKALLQTWWKDH